MFNLPLEQVNFETLRKFCLQKPKEDLDLDYKLDWSSDLSRVICGMANVQGGVVLIGVGEIPGTREPSWPPAGVVGTEDDLHQRALQIAYDAIYPPVMPEIAVCGLETDRTRSVVMIRVEASRLLHATDGRRRVYIRVADQGRGYELANISQLEWLFGQRAKSIELREFILNRSSHRVANLWKRSTPSPTLMTYAVPIFPTQLQGFNPAQILKIANTLQPADGISSDTQILPHYRSWRTTSDGAFTNYQGSSLNQYLELGINGLVYFEQELRTYENRESSEGSPRMAMHGPSILSFCKAFLSFAVSYYAQLGWRGPIIIFAMLEHLSGILLDHKIPWLNYLEAGISPHLYCQDDMIFLHQGEYSVRDLKSISGEIFNQMGYSLMWAFGFSDDQEKLLAYLAKLKGA